VLALLRILWSLCFYCKFCGRESPTLDLTRAAKSGIKRALVFRCACGLMRRSAIVCASRAAPRRAQPTKTSYNWALHRRMADIARSGWAPHEIKFRSKLASSMEPAVRNSASHADCISQKHPGARINKCSRALTSAAGAWCERTEERGFGSFSWTHYISTCLALCVRKICSTLGIYSHTQ
jgi:hypothetical protein